MLAVMALSPVLVTMPAGRPAHAVTADAGCDFDGDGFGDLAIGVPGEDASPAAQDAGAVHVMFGTVNGLLAKRDKLWTQDSSGIRDAAEGDTPAAFDIGDQFGAATACGDFDGDGYSDLVVGIPGEDVRDSSGRTVVDAGAIAMLRGAPRGLTADGNQFLHQGLGAVTGKPAAGDEMGRALAVADFNGDGYDDVAVGIAGEDATVGASESDKLFTGGIQVFPGGPAGLTTADRLFTRDSPGFLGAAAFGDGFGAALAAGNFNGDRYADLAVGVPDADPGGRTSGGDVTVIYGSASGLRARNQQLWHLGSPGIQGGVAAADAFGFALAAGDVDGDGYDELAVGIPGKAVNRRPAAGMVSLIFGSKAGLTDRDTLVHQNRAGIKGKSGEGDRFGWSLTVADFDGDGYGDLAVGVPDDLDGLFAAGAVNLIYGDGSGLTTRNDRWRQGLRGVRAEAEPLDSFGETLLARDFDADGYADLAVGVPEEDVGGVADAGAISILYGRDGGLRAIGDRTFHQDSDGIRGTAEAHDFFGFVGSLRRSIDGGSGAALAAIRYAHG
jgi:hypothetical protein